MSEAQLPPGNDNAKRVRITLVRSPLGYSMRHKQTVRALGLRRLHQTIEVADSSAIRGMLYKVSQLVKVEEA